MAEGVGHIFPGGKILLLRGYGIRHLVSVYVAEFRNKRRLDSVNFSEFLLITSGNRQTAGLHFFHTRKLYKTKSSLNIKHIIFVARFHNIIFPAAALGITVPGVAAHAMAGKNTRPLSNVVPVGDQHSTFAGAQVFGGIKAIGGSAAQLVSNKTALVAAPQCMGGIFRNKQSLSISIFLDVLHPLKSILWT